MSNAFNPYAAMSLIVEEPGEVFPSLILPTLIATVVVLVLHCIISWIARRTRGGHRGSVRWNVWEKLLYCVTILAVGTLAGTSFYSVIAIGVLERWLLLVHMTAAGMFVAVLPLIALTWASACRFGGAAAAAKTDAAPALRFLWLTKMAFWLLLFGGLLSIGSMLLSMLHWQGTEGLIDLLNVHRYSSLLVVVATIVHFYGVWLGRHD
jgi:hypothetical protein